MTAMTRVAAPVELMFVDDGSIPNNPRLPMVLYHAAVDLSGTPDPEAVIERTNFRP
jgi:uncharacterized protein YjlB